jgi:hypothetical protein
MVDGVAIDRMMSKEGGECFAGPGIPGLQRCLGGVKTAATHPSEPWTLALKTPKRSPALDWKY